MLRETELEEGVDTLVEPAVWVDELRELGRPLGVDVESSPDEVLAVETVDVRPVEVLPVPETAGELVMPLLTVVGSVWLAVFDVDDVQWYWPVED